MSFSIAQIHKDWAYDDLEKSAAHGWEDLWRLDPVIPGKIPIQVQLFARTYPQHDRSIRWGTYVRYTGFRLFIERDERDDRGEVRVDYAGANFPCTIDAGLWLLAVKSEWVVTTLEEQLKHVWSLPSGVIMEYGS